MLCAFHVHFCTFLHIANTDLFENIVEHFSFRAPADVRGNVLKCFKQKTTFLHIFLHLVLHHISSTLWFYSQQGLFFYVFYVHFPKNVFLCAKMFFYVHFYGPGWGGLKRRNVLKCTQMYIVAHCCTYFFRCAPRFHPAVTLSWLALGTACHFPNYPL